jgi:hypothetical protein
MKIFDRNSQLPEPVALTPDQLQEIATKTAGGLSSFASVIIRAGGIPAFPMFAAANIAQQQQY